MTPKRRIFVTEILLVAVGAVGAAAQEPQGPIRPPAERKVTRIPIESKPEPPALPPEEIIRRFAAKEDEFQRARLLYAYQKTVRVQELDENNKPAGEFQLTTALVVAPDGKRYEKIVHEPPPTLHRMKLAPEDLETLARIPPFVLTSEQLSKYTLTYEGTQPLDELTTYVFRVKPRQLERQRAYFEGVVWADDRELVIVKTYGRWLTEIGEVSSPEFPFTMFETYRENIEGKYWFPTYVRSDDALRLKSGEVPIRLVVRWTDYKPLAPSSSSAAPQTPPVALKPPPSLPQLQ